MADLNQAVFRPEAFFTRLAQPDSVSRLAEVAAGAGVSAAAWPALVQQHGQRIAARFSPRIARLGERFLDHLWTRLFDGIEVRGTAPLAGWAQDYTLVYLPCHRSHLDYLLVSYVLHRAGLLPPHIAAGDNLDLPLLGPLLRRGGGFFMRRRFKGDPLYAEVFAQYLETLLERGLPIEFFIEGGRSRSGAMLAPKTGLLGMMLAAYLRAPPRSLRPVRLVPIYVGYEKVAEGASYLRELSGLPKQKESLAGLLGTLDLLRQRYGRPCVCFGETLVLDEWLDAHDFPDTHDVDGAPGAPGAPGARWRDAYRAPATAPRQWAAGLVNALADEVVGRIADAAYVNPVNLVALALLSSPAASATRNELIERIAWLQSQVAGRVTALSPAACLARAIDLGMVTASADSIRATGQQAELLAYFRHNVLHLFPEET